MYSQTFFIDFRIGKVNYVFCHDSATFKIKLELLLKFKTLFKLQTITLVYELKWSIYELFDVIIDIYNFAINDIKKTYATKRWQ